MHIVIIGNGITGITAARTLRKNSDCDITVISGETDYFFSRTALMYIYMGHMRFKDTQPYEPWFWEKNRIKLKKGWIEKVNTEDKSIVFDSGELMQFDKLLIASGAKSNKFGWPGQDLNGVQGLYSYQDLQSLEKNTANGINRAVIVGGGLIGIEMAEMLHSRHFPVTLLVREQSYWSNILPLQESQLITKHIKDLGFDLRLNETLKEIIGDENGNVKSIITGNNEVIECNIVGLTAGVSPNIDFLKNSGINLDRGVIINDLLQTNKPDVYAAGDCAQFQVALPDRRPIEQVWYTGKLQGETAALNMLGHQKNYQPGYWFNSAKFLEIEYQTYGTVLSALREGESEFYWESTDNQKCLHVVYRTSDHLFIGMNVFGIRMRHQLFNKWLIEKQSVEHVMSHLNVANFDPEFFKQFEQQIINAWNKQHPQNMVVLKPKSVFSKLLFGN